MPTVLPFELVSHILDHVPNDTAKGWLTIGSAFFHRAMKARYETVEFKELTAKGVEKKERLCDSYVSTLVENVVITRFSDAHEPSAEVTAHFARITSHLSHVIQLKINTSGHSASFLDTVLKALSQAAGRSMRVLDVHTDWKGARLVDSINFPQLTAVSFTFRCITGENRASAGENFPSIVALLSLSCATLEKLSISFKYHYVDASGLYRRLCSIRFRRLVDVAILTPFVDGIMSDNGEALSQFLRTYGSQLEALSLIPTPEQQSQFSMFDIEYQKDYLRCLTSIVQDFPHLRRLSVAAVGDWTNQGKERLDAILDVSTKMIGRASETLSHFAICDYTLNVPRRNLILDTLSTCLLPGGRQLQSLSMDVGYVTGTLLDKLAREFSELEDLFFCFDYLAPDDNCKFKNNDTSEKRIWLYGIPDWVKKLWYPNHVLGIDAQRFFLVMAGRRYSKWRLRKFTVLQNLMSTCEEEDDPLEEILNAVIREAVPSLQWK